MAPRLYTYSLLLAAWGLVLFSGCSSENRRSGGSGADRAVKAPVTGLVRPADAVAARSTRPAPMRRAAADTLRQRPLFRGGVGRRGRVPGPGPRARQLAARYSVRLARRVHSAAVSDGRRVFVVSERGLAVAARVADGKILWSRSTRSGVDAAPGLGDGRLFIGDRAGRVWCLSADSGRVLWQRKLRGAVRTAPLPLGDVVVVGTHGGLLAALDAKSGGVRWQLKQRHRFLGVAGSADGRLVAAVSLDRRVRLLDAGSGQLRWTAALASSSRVVPILAKDAVYVLCASGELVRLDLKNGAVKWRRAGLGYKSHPPALAGGRLYVASRKRLLYALDATTGKTIWVKPMTHAPSAPPVFARDTVFVVNHGPTLLAIRADNGGHYIHHSLPAPVRAEPLALGNALLLVDQRGIATLYVNK